MKAPDNALLFGNSWLEAQPKDGMLILTSRRTPQTFLHSTVLAEVRSTTGAPLPGMLTASQWTWTREAIQDALGSGEQWCGQATVGEGLFQLRHTVTIYPHRPFAVVQLALDNQSTSPIALHRLVPLSCVSSRAHAAIGLNRPPATWSCYRQGWQSWSFTGTLPPGSGDPRAHFPSVRAMNDSALPADLRLMPGTGRPAEVISDGMTLIGTASGPSLLVGFLSGNRYIGHILVDRRKITLAATEAGDGQLLKPGQTAMSEPLAIGFGAEGELLAAYAEAVGLVSGARIPKAPPIGWCSWYYYFSNVSERDIRENVSALQELRATIPLEVVQIDDGYQAAAGEWLKTNERFPSDMRDLAKTIRDAGFRPGIWLAPFTVSADSQFYREHPACVLRDTRGKPVYVGRGANTYSLDCTHPESLDWLKRLFATVVGEWGFSYLKLDFLFRAALPGQRYDPTSTRAEALYRGLRTIRETVGDDVFILGCGCPLFPAIGLCDGMRISADVGPDWTPRYRKRFPLPLGDGASAPAALNAIRNTLARKWMDGFLWQNDPDCLLLREENTALTQAEMQSLATIIGLTGGMLFLSERVAALPPDRLDILARLTPPIHEGAHPRSLLAQRWPNVIVSHVERDWGEWWLAGIENWEARPRQRPVTWEELGLPPGCYDACEFWSNAYLGRSERGVTLNLPAHGAAALAIYPFNEQPHIMGSSYHIGQGAVELADVHYDATEATFRWRIALMGRRAGTIRISLPANTVPGELTTDATDATIQWDATTHVASIRATVDRSATFTLHLARAQ